jgi:hypothetical protein
LCLEGNAPIPLDVGPQILDRFRQDFDVAPEGLRRLIAHFSATCGGLILLPFERCRLALGGSGSDSPAGVVRFNTPTWHTLDGGRGTPPPTASPPCSAVSPRSDPTMAYKD